jgi:hypothetical protein
VSAEKNLMAAELELMSAAVWRNEHRIRELLHPDFLEIGRSGRLWTRDDIIAAFVNEHGRTPPHVAEWCLTSLTADLVLLTIARPAIPRRAGTAQFGT